MIKKIISLFVLTLFLSAILLCNSVAAVSANLSVKKNIVVDFGDYVYSGFDILTAKCPINYSMAHIKITVSNVVVYNNQITKLFSNELFNKNLNGSYGKLEKATIPLVDIKSLNGKIPIKVEISYNNLGSKIENSKKQETTLEYSQVSRSSYKKIDVKVSHNYVKGKKPEDVKIPSDVKETPKTYYIDKIKIW